LACQFHGFQAFHFQQPLEILGIHALITVAPSWCSTWRDNDFLNADLRHSSIPEAEHVVGSSCTAMAATTVRRIFSRL
jgi:hypothetical protein